MVVHSQIIFNIDNHLFLKATENVHGRYQIGLWWTETCFNLQGQCNLNTTCLKSCGVRMNKATIKYSLYKSEKAEKIWKWGIKIISIYANQNYFLTI